VLAVFSYSHYASPSFSSGLLMLSSRHLSFRHLSFNNHLTRTLSSRASNILHALGLPTSGELKGVYDGQWKGSGEITQSICPTTGELLATVRTASSQEVHTAIQKSREAYRIFRSM